MEVYSDWAENAGRMLGSWARTLDPDLVFVVLGIALGLIVLRTPLARLAVSITSLLLEQLGLRLTEEVRVEARRTYAALIFVLALLFALDGLAPPAIADGILRLVLIATVVVIVYSSLFRRSDLLVALALHRKGDAGLDAIWIKRVLQLVLIVLCFASVLDVLGLDISGAVAGLGVFGAGLAIASQDFVRNLVAGMNTASEGRFAPGDWISTDQGVEGTVVSMDIRSTKIVGFDRVPQFVPNNDLANAVLRNHSRMDHRRVSLKVGLMRDASDESVDRFCQILEDYARSCGDFVLEGDVPLFVAPVGISAMALEVQIYLFTVTASFEEYTRACGRLALAIRKSAETAGTDLAYPVSTIQVTEQTARAVAGSVSSQNSIADTNIER